MKIAVEPPGTPPAPALDLWYLEALGFARDAETPRSLWDEPIVGLLDSGADPIHVALAAYRRAPERLSFTLVHAGGRLEAAAPRDLQDGHGTTAAALIGGSPVGVAPGVPLAVAAAVPGSRFTADPPDRLQAIEAGVRWLVETEHLPGRVGVDVLCVNAAVYGDAAGFLDQALRDARGVLVIAPAGNADPLAGPARAPAALAVGWHDARGVVPRGLSGRAPELGKPELVAPGAALPRCDPGYPDRYSRADGSSYAAPLAAGAAAWLMRRDPSLRRDPARLREALLRASPPILLDGGGVSRRLRLSPPPLPLPPLPPPP